MILFEHLYIYFYIENNVYTVKSKRREPDPLRQENAGRAGRARRAGKRYLKPRKKSGKIEIRKNDHRNSEKMIIGIRKNDYRS